MTSVTIFNANNLGITVSVNNGQQFSIAAAASTSWIPAASGAPTWSNTAAAPNVIAPGNNYLSVTPAGAVQPMTIIMALPGSIQWISVQIYLFFNSYTDASWILLNDGQFVTGNIKLSAFQSSAGFPAAEANIDDLLGSE